MNSDNKLFPAVYAADLAKTIAADMHEHIARELAHTGDALLLEIQALRALLDETQDLCKAVLKIDAPETKSAL